MTNHSRFRLTAAFFIAMMIIAFVMSISVGDNPKEGTSEHAKQD